MHKITNLWKFKLDLSSKLQDNNGRRKNLVTWSCVFSEAYTRNLKIKFWGLAIKFKYFKERNNFFLKNDVSSQGAVFSQCFILSTSLHWLLTSKSLSYNYFDQLPKVPSAFKWNFQVSTHMNLWCRQNQIWCSRRRLTIYQGYVVNSSFVHSHSAAVITSKSCLCMYKFFFKESF